MNKINILYVDDKPESQLVRYLKKFVETHNEGYELFFNQLNFKCNYTIESFFQNAKVIDADIIVLDSQLYEHSSCKTPRIHGEELHILICENFCFKQVVVLSQYKENIGEKYGIIPKYKSRTDGANNSEQHYADELEPALIKKIQSILEMRNILHDKILQNNTIEKCKRDELQDLMELGNAHYRKLTDMKIDEMISIIKEIKDKIKL